MDRFSDLDVLLEHIWSYVADAADDTTHPFRLPTFGTTQPDPEAGTPEQRTVVLRAVDRDSRVLAFHSDRRSAKVDAIQAGSRVTWHGWDAGRSQQLRLRGTATIHTDDDVADAMWEAASLDERKLYVRSPAPGTAVDAPQSGLPDAFANGDLTEGDVAAGRQHFAALQTTIDEIAFLHLHADGHYRARFRYDADAEAFESTWVIP